MSSATHSTPSPAPASLTAPLSLDTDKLVELLSDPDLSLNEIASDLKLSTACLSLYLESEEGRALFVRAHHAAIMRVRLAATCQLHRAVTAVVTMLAHYEHESDQLHRDAPPTRLFRELQRTNARRAAHLLARLANLQSRPFESQPPTPPRSPAPPSPPDLNNQAPVSHPPTTFPSATLSAPVSSPFPAAESAGTRSPASSDSRSLASAVTSASASASASASVSGLLHTPTQSAPAGPPSVAGGKRGSASAAPGQASSRPGPEGAAVAPISPLCFDRRHLSPSEVRAASG